MPSQPNDPPQRQEKGQKATQPTGKETVAKATQGRPAPEDRKAGQSAPSGPLPHQKR